MNIKKTSLFLFFSLLLFCGQFVPEFNAERSFEYLKKQTGFGPRIPGSIFHNECREWLVEKLKSTSERVVEQKFQHHDPRLDTTIVLTNIVASFNLNASKRVLLCAHWDTRPRADMDSKENINTPIIGANDGASGVAVLLEIAGVVKGNKPDVGLDIVLFDGEDYGPEEHIEEYFLGSRYFAENLRGYKPIYGILLDMVGDAQLNIPKEPNSNRYATKVVDKVWNAAKKLGYTQFEDKTGTAVNDDHIQLLSEGISCIDIIDFQYPDKSRKYWHTLQDTPDKCSPQSLKAVGQTILEVIYSE